MPKNNSKYWKGPAGVLIPNSINEVPCLDNINTCFRSGFSTEQWNQDDRKPYTVYQYRKKFAEHRRGKWYWKIDEIFDLEKEVPEYGIIDRYIKAPLNKLFPNEWDTYKTNLINSYWKGPFDIMIPDCISMIPGINGGIILQENQNEYYQGPITRNREKTYKQKYATLHDDGKWYWKIHTTTTMNLSDDYKGPFFHKI